MSTYYSKTHRDDRMSALGGAHARLAIQETGSVCIALSQCHEDNDGNTQAARVGRWVATFDEVEHNGMTLTSFGLAFDCWVKSFDSIKSARASASQRNAAAWKTANWA